MLDARYFGPVLDGDAEPHMDRATTGAVALPKEVAHEGRAFCEYLKCVPRRAFHSIEHAINEILGNVLVEEIAHGIHKDHAARAPPERLIQPLRTKCKVETCLEWMTWTAAKSFGKALGITVIASGTDLRAASDRVPGGVGPLYCGRISHDKETLEQKWNNSNYCEKRQRQCARKLFPNDCYTPSTALAASPTASTSSPQSRNATIRHGHPSSPS